jgi:hypothetical protein
MEESKMKPNHQASILQLFELNQPSDSSPDPHVTRSKAEQPNPSSPLTASCARTTRRRGPGFLRAARDWREQCRWRWREAPGLAAGCRRQPRRAAAPLRLGGAATAVRRRCTWRRQRRETGRCRARSEAPSTPWTRSRIPCPAG